MNKQRIKELALANGFKLKEQSDGSVDLNTYVYEFALVLMAEAGRAGFVAGAEMWSDYGVKSRYKDDYLVDIEADASKYAEKVRNGK